MFVKLSSPPSIPQTGEFLLPVCIDVTDLLKLIRHLDYYKRLTSDFDHAPLNRIFQAIEYIGREDLAPCLMDNTLPDDGDCNEYPPYAPFIEWFPQNPFTEPGTIPGGYISPPFVRFEDFINLPDFIPAFFEDIVEGLASELTNYQRGDVLSFLQSIPIVNSPVFPEMNNGYPTFKVSVTGTGVVELHLLAVPLGGIAVVSVDVQPDILSILDGVISGNIQLIELNRDVLAVPPELDEDNIEEITLETPGNHEIYVTFIPRLNDEVPFLFFGGGLRKVVLCGDDLQPGTATVPIVNVIDDCRVDVSYDGGQTFQTVIDLCNEVTMQLRQNPESPCILESSTDGTVWIQWADLSSCVGADGMPGADGREVEFQKSATHIQWRHVGDVDWINLVALDELKGADGQDGREVEFQKSATHIQWRYVGEVDWIDLVALTEITGADGQDGADGAPGQDGQGASDNQYPDPPTQATPDELCNAVYYIMDRVIQFIDDTLTDASTITLDEFLSALLGQGGWDASLLKQFWDLMVANSYPNLLTDVQTARSEVAEYFYCHEIDRDSVILAIDYSSTIGTDAQAALIGALNAISDSKLALWAFVGSQIASGEDCNGFNCGATWEQVFDFAVDDYDEWVGTLDPAYPPVYIAGVGWEGGRDAKGVRAGMIIQLPSPQEITFAEAIIRYKTTATNTRACGISLSQFAVPWNQTDLGKRTDLPNGNSTRNYEAIVPQQNILSIIGWTGSREGTSSYERVTKIILRGKGENPFV